MGLIPVKLDIEGLYEPQDRRRKKSTPDKVVPPHVHSVCSRALHLEGGLRMADSSPSAAGLRTALRRERSATGRRSA
jgi:hypothetical protein